MHSLCLYLLDNYMNTILIASGSTVLACVLFFFIFLIDFHFYKKKKHRNKIIRSQGHIKSGQNRPTSFIISKERHKLLSLYMSPHYREPQTTRTDTKQLQRTLDSDINRALDPGHGSVVTRKASKGKRTKNKRKVTSDSIEVATQTDNSLMDTTLNGATVTRSGARRKKKKRHQIEPMAKNDGILQPMSLSLNGNIPILAKPSGDAAMVRYPDDYRDTHGWGIPFDDPLGDHYAPEVSRQPVRQVRRLPPRPGTVSGGYRGESAEQEISMVDETAYRFQQHALSSWNLNGYRYLVITSFPSVMGFVVINSENSIPSITSARRRHSVQPFDVWRNIDICRNTNDKCRDGKNPLGASCHIDVCQIFLFVFCPSGSLFRAQFPMASAHLGLERVLQPEYNNVECGRWPP